MAKRTITISRPSGEIVFSKEDFEYPDSWSVNAASTFAKNYTLPNEHSVNDALDRILNNMPNLKESIRQAILDQKACFNSPVMFNFGVHAFPMGSACFILDVEDDMESISRLNTNFMRIYKNGAGAGVNVSSLRGSMEKLRHSDGVASGPLSFMRIADTIAGVVKSGGRQRRAAKGVWIDIDHPDVEEFITAKMNEENKALVLAAAGYGYDITSESYATIAFQNMNISIRLTDKFMQAVENNEDWNLIARTDGSVIKTVRARDLLMKIAEASHKCGDPGVQFHDTINKDNPFASLGKRVEFKASNPCAEFNFIGNSACNLASINLKKFYDGNKFDFDAFGELCHDFILAMDNVIDVSGYPTDAIDCNSRKYRPLGLGYTGLGTVLMQMGLPYGSEEALVFVDKVTHTMAISSWKASNDLYLKYGSSMSRNLQDLLSKHVSAKYFSKPIYGFRNAQTTLLAPTGTISIIMDTLDSTGIEPVTAIKAYKTTVSGNVIQVMASGVDEASRKTGSTDYANHPVFATSIGENTVSIDAHLNTMATAQKWLCGSISKTVNLPINTTVKEVFDLYIKAWKLGIKSLALYRAGSKMNEPLKKDNNEKPIRRRMPRTRVSTTHHFEIMGSDGYITLGYYDDGRIGEIFVSMTKIGSTVQGLINAWSVMASSALQYGVPIEDIIRKFKGSMFDPAGITDNPEIEMCSSVLDYVVRYIEIATNKTQTEVEVNQIIANDDNIRVCPDCGNIMTLVGRCHLCRTCGVSGGCS